MPQTSCELCEIEDAKKRCDTCKMSFCETCDEDYHAASKLAGHIRTDVNKRASASVEKELCAICNDVVPTLTCKDCDMHLCDSCNVELHGTDSDHTSVTYRSVPSRPLFAKKPSGRPSSAAIRKKTKPKPIDEDIEIDLSSGDDIEIDLDDDEFNPKKSSSKRVASPKRKLCDICNDARATVHCRDCDMNMCDVNDCNKQMHEGALNSAHKVDKLNDRTSLVSSKSIKSPNRNNTRSLFDDDDETDAALERRINFASTNVPTKELDRFVEVFMQFAKRRTGTLSRDKVVYAFKELDRKETRDDVEDLFSEECGRKSDSMDLAQFISIASKKAKVERAADYDQRFLEAAQGLSSEQISKFRKAFQLFDKSGNGQITKSQLKSALKDLGQDPTQDEVDDLMYEVDKDGSGTIDFPEFVEMLKKKMGIKKSSSPRKKSFEQRMRDASQGLSRSDVDKFKKAFELFDRNGSGRLTEDDLYSAMRQLGQAANRSAVKDVMREMDVDGNGSIELPEFILMMARKKGKRQANMDDDNDYRNKSLSRNSSSKSIGDADYKRRVARNSVGLTHDEIDKFRRTFDHFDKNGNGYISRSELQDAMTDFGHRATRREVDEIMRGADLDMDGNIDWPEFLGMMKKKLEDRAIKVSAGSNWSSSSNNSRRNTPSKDTRRDSTWQDWKKEKSGFGGSLSSGKGRRSEERERLKEASEFLTPAEVKKFKQAFDRFDKDGSGTVSSAELYKVFREAGQKPAQAEDSVSAVLDKAKEAGMQGDEVDFPQFLIALGADLRKERQREREIAADGLSDAQVKRLKEIFDSFDKDGSGAVSDTEMYKVFREAGQRPADAEKSVKTIMSESGDKTEITFTDFLRAMNNSSRSDIGSPRRGMSRNSSNRSLRGGDDNNRNNRSSNSEKEMLIEAAQFLYKHEIKRFKDAFDKFDLDGSGTVSKNELYKVFRESGQRPGDAEASAKKVMDEAGSRSEVTFAAFLMVMGRNLREERRAQQDEVTKGLSREEVEKFRTVFDKYDADNSGTVSKNELYKMFRDFGQRPADAEASVKELTSQDGHDEFTFRDFVGALAKKRSRKKDEDKDALVYAARELYKNEIKLLKDAFDSFDADNSGTVSQGELYKVFRKSGQSPADAEASSNAILKDGKRTLEEITFTRFLEYMGDKIRAKRADGLHRASRGLSGQEVKRLRVAFDKFDEDMSGFVDSEELYKVFREAGQSPSQAEQSSKDVLTAAKDKEAGVTFMEFVGYMSRRKRGSDPYAKDSDSSRADISQMKRSQLRRVFRQADKDKSGSVDSKELGSLLRKAGENPTPLELSRLIDHVDADRDGQLDFDEFVEFFAIFQAREEEYRKRLKKSKLHLTSSDISTLKEAFDKFDVNGNRQIEMNELAQVLRAAGKLVTGEMIRAVMDDADKNKDGVIDFPEFLELMGKQLKHDNIATQTGLSDKEVARFHEAFNEFDRKGEGYITVRDLEKTMRKGGRRVTVRELNALMKRADKDGSGTIDFPEFLELMTGIDINSYEARLERASARLTKTQVVNFKRSFNAYDRNKDGKLNRREIAAVLRKSGEEVTKTQVNAMMDAGDTNNDGVIDFAEFLELVADQLNPEKTDYEEKVAAASKGLTEEQVKQFQEAFDTFDRSGRGEITVGDLAATMRKSGQRPSADQLKQIMEEADEDGSGTIDFPEFLNLMGKHAKATNKADAAKEGLTDEQVATFKEAFDSFDRSGNGEITIGDLAATMRKSGQRPSAAQLKQIMSEADEDGSGTIDFPEFLNLMGKQAKADNDFKQRMEQATKYLTEEQVQSFETSFNSYDENENGKIELKELNHVIRDSGYKVSASELRDIMAEADKNHDGVLDFPEFLNLMGKENQRRNRLEVAKEGLTEDQIAEFKDAFNEFDRRGKGEITVKDLAATMRKSGQRPTATQLKSIMEEADEDGSGTIDFAEFLNLMGKHLKASNTYDDRLKAAQKHLSKEQIESFRAAFDKFDLNGDNSINTRELRKVLLASGEVMVDNKVEEIMNEADKNRDGSIDFAEFLTLMSKQVVEAAEAKKRLSVAQRILSKKDLVAFRAAFNKADRAKNGSISIHQLDNALKHLVVESVIKRNVARDVKVRVKGEEKDYTLDLGAFLLLFCPADAMQDEEIREAMSDAKNRLTKQQMSQFKKVFKEYDLDGNNKIDVKELKVLMLNSGEKPTKAKLREVMLEADLNNDGTIDYREFIILMAKHFGTEEEDEDAPFEAKGLSDADSRRLEKSFNHFDEFNEGELSTKTLFKVLRHWRSGEKVSVKEFTQICKVVDPSNSGSVGRAVFVMGMDEYTRKANAKAHADEQLSKLTKGLTDDVVEALQVAFQKHSLDEEEDVFSGRMALKRVGKVLRAVEVEVKGPELRKALEGAKADEEGSISFVECLRIVGPMIRKQLQMARLAEVTAKMTKADVVAAKVEFDKFDTDSSNSINRKELGSALKKLGFNLSKAEIKAIVEEGDTSGDGEIDFVEFLIMVQNRREAEEEANMTPEEREAREERRALLAKEDEMLATYERLGMQEEYDALMAERKEREEEEKKNAAEREQYKKLGMLKEYEELLETRKRDKSKKEAEEKLAAARRGLFGYNVRKIRAEFDEETDGEDMIPPKAAFRVLSNLKKPFKLGSMVTLMGEIKQNEDGLVSFGEFLHVLAPAVKKHQSSLDAEDRLELVSEGISKEDLSALQDAFVSFDKSGNGKINIRELGKLLKAVGYPTDKEAVKAAMKDLDINGDGQLDFPEFVDFIAERVAAKTARKKALEEASEGLTQRQIKIFSNAFAVFDPKKTGLAPVKDLRKLLTELKQPHKATDVGRVQKQLDLVVKRGAKGVEESYFTLAGIVSVVGAAYVEANEKKKAKEEELKKKKALERRHKLVNKAKKELTSKQYRAMKEAFDDFDMNGNGTISSKELYKVLKQLGERPTAAYVIELVKEADIDDSGELDFGEFLVLCVLNERKKAKSKKHEHKSKKPHGKKRKSKTHYISSHELPNCNVCDSEVSVVWCNDCEEGFCAEDDADLHADEEFADHKRLKITTKKGAAKYSDDESDDFEASSDAVSDADSAFDSESSEASDSGADLSLLKDKARHPHKKKPVAVKRESKRKAAERQRQLNRKASKDIPRDKLRLFTREFRAHAQPADETGALRPVHLVKVLKTLGFKLTMNESMQLIEEQESDLHFHDFLKVLSNMQEKGKKGKPGRKVKKPKNAWASEEEESETKSGGLSLEKVSRGVSKADLAEMKFVFEQFDSNKDGKITQGELYKALREQFGLNKHEAEKRSSETMDEFDLNEDGTISMAEFIAMAKRMPNKKLAGAAGSDDEGYDAVDKAPMSERQQFDQAARGLAQDQIDSLRQCFELYDRDGTNKIHINDLANCMQALEFTVNATELVDTIDKAPVNKHGQLSWVEYVRIMRKYSLAKRINPTPLNASLNASLPATAVPSDVRAEMDALRHEVRRLREDKRRHESLEQPKKETKKSATKYSTQRFSGERKERKKVVQSTAKLNRFEKRPTRAQREASMSRLSKPTRTSRVTSKTTRKSKKDDKKTMAALREQAVKLRAKQAAKAEEQVASYLPLTDDIMSVDQGFSDNASVVSSIQPPVSDEAQLAAAITQLTKSLDRQRKAEARAKKREVVDRLTRTNRSSLGATRDEDGVLYHPDAFVHDQSMSLNNSLHYPQPQPGMDDGPTIGLPRYDWEGHTRDHTGLAGANVKVNQIDNILDNLKQQSMYYSQILDVSTDNVPVLQHTTHTYHSRPQSAKKSKKKSRKSKKGSKKLTVTLSSPRKSGSPRKGAPLTSSLRLDEPNELEALSHSFKGEDFYSIDFDSFADKLQTSPQLALDWLTRKQRALLTKKRPKSARK